VCGDKGDLQLASDYHQRALEIELEQLGPNHMDVAGSYNNLGVIIIIIIVIVKVIYNLLRIINNWHWKSN
jgi:hypothetical protein